MSDTSGIKIFDGENGDYLGVFGDTSGEFLLGTAIHPVSGNLLAGNGAGYIAEYDVDTGALIGIFGDSAEHVNTPLDLVFHPVTGNLLVLEAGTPFPIEILPVVQEYDGATGNFIGDFGETGPNLTPSGQQHMAFSPISGNLLISDAHDVREFDGATGDYLGVFGTTDTETRNVADLAIHPATGNVFVADSSNNDIREFDATSGAFIGSHDAGGTFRRPTAIAFTPPDSRASSGSVNGNVGPSDLSAQEATVYHGFLLVLHDPVGGEIISVLDLLTGAVSFDFGEDRLVSALNFLYAFGTSVNLQLSSGNLGQAGEAADPVNTFTGELHDDPVTELSFGGPLPLTFTRYYASNLKSDANIRGSLGDNWLHNFDFRLTKRGPEVTVINNRGRVITFEQNGVTWELTGRRDIAFQLAGSGTNFVMLDPRTGLMYTFNPKGKLTRIEDGRGNAHRLTYSTDGRLIHVSDGLGREMFFTYSFEQLGNGGPRKLIQVTDRGPTRTVLFAHTGDDLTSVTDVRGNVTAYTYDSGGLKTSTRRPGSNVPFTQTWTAAGKIGTQADADGNAYGFTYNALRTTITDPVGNTLTHTHTATGELANRVDEAGLGFSMSSDAAGRRDSLTDRLGDATAVVYEAESGNVESVTIADGSTYSYSYSPRELNGVTHHDLTGVIHADGTTEGLAYDDGGNLTSHTDPAGNTSSATYNGNGRPLTETNRKGGTTINTYNSDATLATSTDPAGNMRTYRYDSVKRPDQITFADGSKRGMTYDLSNNLLTITDENNGTTTFTYDDNDRLLTTTDPLGGDAGRTYSPLGKLASSTDANGHTTTFGYDSLIRLTSITDPLGHPWSITYDAEGVITSRTDPLLHTRTYASDVMGRIIRTTSPLGYTTEVTYDAMGRVTSATDELNLTTRFTWDSRGLLSGMSLPGESISASYTRNELGLVTQITDPNGNDWNRAYDDMGRLISSTDPLGNSETIAYDNRNRPGMITFPGGLGTLSNGYDRVGNLTSRTYSDGTTYGYAYDANNRLTSADGINLTYDANGRIIDSNGIGNVRDPAGRITLMTLGSGKAIEYSYDANDRLVSITDWVGGSTTFTYDEAGRLTRTTRPNGIDSTRIHDDDNRLVGLGEGALSTIALTRDGRGRITQALRDVPLPVSLNSLASITRSFDEASQPGDATYDAMGRVTTDGTRVYEWDLSSRLTRVTTSGESVASTYDALGFRLSRTADGITRSFVWNHALGLTSISIERQGDGDLRYYVHTPDGRLLHSVDAATNARHFYHYDEMGNTLFLSDDTGGVAAGYAYSPYGRLVAESGDIDNSFTWNGMNGVTREGNNLYYVRARYYDADSGRFLSRDPVKSIDPVKINPYQYALGSPLQFVDVTGTRSENFDEVVTEFNKASAVAANAPGAYVQALLEQANAQTAASHVIASNPEAAAAYKKALYSAGFRAQVFGLPVDSPNADFDDAFAVFNRLNAATRNYAVASAALDEAPRSRDRAISKLVGFKSPLEAFADIFAPAIGGDQAPNSGANQKPNSNVLPDPVTKRESRTRQWGEYTWKTPYNRRPLWRPATLDNLTPYSQTRFQHFSDGLTEQERREMGY